MRYFHKGVRRLCAIVIGLVFFLAGLLKLQDPVGAGLVVKEYFNFFHLSFLSGASVYVAVALALLETLCGAALIAGVRRAFTASLTVIGMIREILGSGSIFGWKFLAGDGILAFVMAPGAFLVLGYLMVLFNKFLKKE